MNIVIGASGQIGAAIVQELKQKQVAFRAIVRSTERSKDNTIETALADLFNADQLVNAFEGGTTAFLLTPENPSTHDIIGDTRQIIANYKRAIELSGIKRIIGLSCVGAHIDDNTGNILQSRMLEQAFDDLPVEKLFIRPSYFYSNWLGYIETMQEASLLPTFFPAELKIEMNAPTDVACFIAEAMLHPTKVAAKQVIELTGPQQYSAADVASVFSQLLGKIVKPQPIPKEQWETTLLSAGFTANTASHLSAMTAAVVDGLATLEDEAKAVKLPTSLYEYLSEHLPVS
jgi:uncharacterized protein YbjT (DUF2867 family)